MTEAVDWAAARRIAAAAAPRPAAERVGLADALGRTLAAPLVTALDLPHYASSAMDGWAVRGPAPWRLIGPAGAPGAGEPGLGIGIGEAQRIVTGGVVPRGADAVLRAEAGRVDRGTLEPVGEVGLRDVREGRHIRLGGSEARAGDRLLEAGTPLTPPRIALAAATGADVIEVVRRPRVAVVLTGDEVVESGVPGPGRVRDSFRVALPAALRALGAEVVGVARVPDDAAATRAAMTSADADLVVSTGGTGRSDADHVRAALADLGADLLVPSVAIRPGGPTLLARIADRLVLGLPGNPLAAMLGLLAVGGPLLHAWSGAGPADAAAGQVRAGTALDGGSGVTALVPAVLGPDGSAVPTGYHGAGMLRGLAGAEVVLVVPPDGVGAGDAVTTLRLPWAG
ncbi:molybdopterin molybdotransferase MoeA [Agromyces marinus]|uniref:molybdopterin molybdotransferase MoeA n=1 Tax=Agromyces marinus TaxID=1389020 RepID=UPI001F238A37|nr:molybdopterin molybdotransferase MoeA [Agromyces marinus]